MEPVFILLLFGAGLTLLLIELLVPSAGLLFAASLACLAWSVYGSFQHGNLYGVVHLIGALGACLAVGWWGLNRMTHRGSQPTAEGFSATEDSLTALREAVGKAVTPLRPGGCALIEGKRVDVVTRGEFIESETALKVIEVEGNRVVVRAVRPEDGNKPPKPDAPPAGE